MEKKSSFRLGPHPFLFIMGYKRISVSAGQLETMLNLCRKMSVRYWAVSITENGAELCIPFFSAKRLLEAAAASEISVNTVQNGGIPALILKHRLRLGVPIGLICAVIMIILSGSVIWDVRVDGAQKISERETEDILRECGLYVGVRKSRLDVDVIENRVLILSESISWISINLRGTVANVEIREIDFPPEDTQEDERGDLISNADGIVLRVEDTKGSLWIKPGDTVVPGQLLIGSLYGNGNDPFKSFSPQGKVFAECVDSFTINIPRAYQKKSYSDKVRCEKYLIFFENEIKFFGNCGNLPSTCDKIEKVEYLRSPSGDDLPFGIRTVIYREYSYTEDTRSDEELSRLADYKLRTEVAAAIPDAEILGISTDFELSEDRYVLTRKIRCVRNIAVRKQAHAEQSS